MYHQTRQIRPSTLAISQSIKYRRNCILQSRNNKQNNQIGLLMDQQNIKPLFERGNISINNSVQSKKQSRRKAGSIVKIDRNKNSLQKQSNALSRIQLADGSNYLNTKLQYDRNRQESVGVYKKLYQQNKVLNEALKSKIYQTNQKAYTNPLIGLSNYNPNCQNIQVSRKLAIENEKAHVFNSKYQKMLDQYDQKKNFIKEELQAMKQKSSLQNFISKEHNNSLVHSKNFETNFSENVKYQSLQKSCYQPFQHQKNYLLRQKHSTSVSKDIVLQKKYYNAQSANKFKQIIRNDKQSEIDKKFKAYQQKLQKHKDFQKRNPSINKRQQSTKKSTTDYSFNQKQSKKSLDNVMIVENLSVKKYANQSLKIFVDLIGKQIQKDQQVRMLKNSLKSVSQQDIQKVCKQKLMAEYNGDKFKLSTEEYDPFYESDKTSKPIEQTIRRLLGAHDIADNYWKNLIKCRLNKAELQQIYDMLNYSKKDEIEINELARELSYHLNKTVRNRQIYSIYQRINPFTKQNFIQSLSAEL